MARPKKAGTYAGHPAYRWRKMYKGTYYSAYLKGGVSTKPTVDYLDLPPDQWTEEGSRKIANEWWEQKLATLTVNPVNAAFQKIVNVPAAELKRRIEAGIQARRIVSLGPIPPDAPPELIDEFIGIGSLDDAEVDHIVPPGKPRRLHYLNQMTSSEPEKSVKAHVQKFLEASKVGKKNRPVKPSTFAAVRLAVEGLPFENLDIADFNEDTIAEYKRWMNESNLEQITKKLRAKIFQRFVRYLWKHRLIEMPRTIDELTWEASPKEIKTYTVTEIKKCLKGLNQRFRAWALLGLNCGMTNADIADLRPSMISGGYLTRKRVKTMAAKNVPIVNYKLWPETIAALATPDSENYWYLSRKGTQLKSGRIEGTTGKLKDLIYLAWSRAGIQIPLKAFRSISATLLEADTDYNRPSYIDHFLGQSPKGLAAKHYAAPSQELFDQMVDYIHEIFFGK